MKVISLIAAAGLLAGVNAAAAAQTVGAGAPKQSVENRQARGQPDTVAKKRGTRCRIVKQNGQTRHVCSRAPVRR